MLDIERFYVNLMGIMLSVWLSLLGEGFVRSSPALYSGMVTTTSNQANQSAIECDMSDINTKKYHVFAPMGRQKRHPQDLLIMLL